MCLAMAVSITAMSLRLSIQLCACSEVNQGGLAMLYEIIILSSMIEIGVTMKVRPCLPALLLAAMIVCSGPAGVPVAACGCLCGGAVRGGPGAWGGSMLARRCMRAVQAVSVEDTHQAASPRSLGTVNTCVCRYKY